MKFDFMFVGLIILGTVVASYILNYFGYLTHSSPMKAKVPSRTAKSATSGRTYVAPPSGTLPKTATKTVSSVGPNEPVRNMMSRGFGSQSFSI